MSVYSKHLVCARVGTHPFGELRNSLFGGWRRKDCTTTSNKHQAPSTKKDLPHQVKRSHQRHLGDGLVAFPRNWAQMAEKKRDPNAVRSRKSTVDTTFGLISGCYTERTGRASTFVEGKGKVAGSDMRWHSQIPWAELVQYE